MENNQKIMTGFKVYKGTKEAFIAAGKDTLHVNAIVFITGGDDASKSCIYALNTYFGNFTEFLSAVSYVKGVLIGDQKYDATVGGGYLPFSAIDPSVMNINAEKGIIEIGLTDTFLNTIGKATDEANIEGSLFARIALLNADVSALDDDNGAIATLIESSLQELTALEEEGDYVKSISQTNGKIAFEMGEFNFDASGTAEGVKNELIGTDTDTKDSTTIKGSKKYTDDAISALIGTATTDADTLGKLEVLISGVSDDAKSYSISEVSDEELAELGTNVLKAYKLIDEDGTTSGEIIPVYKDSSIVEIYLGSKNDYIDEAGELVKNSISETDDYQSLNYVYLNADGALNVVSVDISKFLAESEFGAGLSVNNNGIVEVKRSQDCESFLTVGTDGIKLTGVQEAINSAVLNALQSSDITTGSENGTIAVKGTDVAVKGLGSAAFENKDTFATSAKTYTKTEVDDMWAWEEL